MFGSTIVEVAIGAVYVFLLMSIISSVIREEIDALTETGAVFLVHGILELLHDKRRQLVKYFYDRPLISTPFSRNYMPGYSSNRPRARTSGARLPSNIPAKILHPY